MTGVTSAPAPRRWKPVRRAVTALFVAVALVGSCGLATRRSGLFNNVADEARARADHQAAWQEMGRGGEISRHDMLMLVRDGEGACLTGEANWVTVDMGQRLDVGLRDRGTPIECRFRVRARGVDGLFRVHVWTILLTPMSEERLEVVGLRRNYLQ